MTKSSDPGSRTNTSLGPAVARAIRPFDRALQSALLPGPPPPPPVAGGGGGRAQEELMELTLFQASEGEGLLVMS